MANETHIREVTKKVRLIDANEFWNRLQNVVYDIFTVHEKDGQLTGTASVGYYTETIKEVLKQTKTVDAVPVVHGYNIDEDTPSLFECSICHWACTDTYFGDTADYNFCPNCGAKMDGGNEDV